MKILVTGGAGFIGSHLVDKLISLDHDVTILDNLSSNNFKTPNYLNSKATFIQGDILDFSFLKNLIPKFEAIFHEASSVGIAQSNYEIYSFTKNNCLGTATLLQAIIDTKSKPKLILSASNTTYGEGLYKCDNHGIFHPEIRSKKQVEESGFEFLCPVCNNKMVPVPVSEETPLNCNSLYALSKKFQEESILLISKMYGFPTVILKYFNVFGPRQALSNPYTGVSAIFMNRIKKGNIPIIYEDGFQTRDFVFIEDVVEANILALNSHQSDYNVFNVGSGIPITIISLAEEISRLFNVKPHYEINNSFRSGDIRHCIADNSKIKKVLGWTPKTSFEQGLKKVYEWAKNQESEDLFDKASLELKEKGLV